ncbi:hypothetical protein JOQ06_016848 [Pogonophryne albipinna]|uniref:GP-PDE domain-containing protein n=1 Tax=Pogonophryne albipinna TaxID=1090488 RepID=A0AAD6FHQ5_9TELE|nr:hypothetical protein JOQ06_016848 [Pogonophryne albipinna]
MVTVLEELATDKSMDGVIASVKQVSLSARSAICRIEALSDAVQGSVLCAIFSGEVKEVMDKVMRVIHFVWGTSSTQHRLFRQLVAESVEATHDDLLLHNDVCWLSKGKALDRFCALLDEALGQVTELMVDFIKQLRANFTSRVEDYSIPKDIIAFVRDPLTVRPSGDFTSQAKQMIPSLDEAALEMELIDFQTSSLVSDALRSAESVSAFWVGSSEELKLGKLKVVRRQLLQRYEHQPFVSCLAGLYGCQWRRYQRARAQPGECCCSKVECGSFGLLILTFFLSFLFLYFWSEAQNDYFDFDWFNFGTLGFWFPWSLVLLVIAAALFTYIALLLVLAVCLLSEGQRLYLHWSHKTGIVVALAFSVTATAILSDLWSKEWKTLLLSLQVTAPFLHMAAVSLMAILSWPIALHFFRMNKKVRQVAALALYLSVLFSLYLVPLGMYSPCIKEAGTLGPAPTLIGHRGAPMLAPENTMMSFEKAVEAGGEGLETDVTISYDGVPFLMHDFTLKRTTDVAEVFPNRTHLDASMFTWDELQQLNAGNWGRQPTLERIILSSGKCSQLMLCDSK